MPAVSDWPEYRAVMARALDDDTGLPAWLSDLFTEEATDALLRQIMAGLDRSDVRAIARPGFFATTPLTVVALADFAVEASTQEGSDGDLVAYLNSCKSESPAS